MEKGQAWKKICQYGGFTTSLMSRIADDLRLSIILKETDAYGVPDTEIPSKWNGIIGALLDGVRVVLFTIHQITLCYIICDY
jgi:hypothetical protein